MKTQEQLTAEWDAEKIITAPLRRYRLPGDVDVTISVESGGGCHVLTIDGDDETARMLLDVARQHGIQHPSLTAHDLYECLTRAMDRTADITIL